MDDKIREKLIETGVDVDEAMERFMGHYPLLEKFLKRFHEDENYNKLCKSIAENNVEEAFRSAHTLKGVCANMSMNRLYKVVGEVVEALRDNDLDGAKRLMPDLTNDYKKVIADLKVIYHI